MGAGNRNTGEGIVSDAGEQSDTARPSGAFVDEATLAAFGGFFGSVVAVEEDSGIPLADQEVVPIVPSSEALLYLDE